MEGGSTWRSSIVKVQGFERMLTAGWSILVEYQLLYLGLQEAWEGCVGCNLDGLNLVWGQDKCLLLRQGSA